MAITSEIIGKLGGGSDVQSSAISLEGEKGTTTFSTVTVPSGATILVVLIGEFAVGVESHETTEIRIGGVSVGRPAIKSKNLSVAKVIDSTQDLQLVNGRYEANAFTGTLYLIEL